MDGQKGYETMDLKLSEEAQKELGSIGMGVDAETPRNESPASTFVQEAMGDMFQDDSEAEQTNVDEEEGTSAASTEEETEDDDSTSTETDSETEDEDDSEAEPATDIEYVKADGKRVKVDFNNREHIKRVYSMAAGARKWQSERDTAIRERDETQAEYEKLQETWNALEAVKDDDSALYELMTGRTLEDRFEEWAKERTAMSRMSESELTAYQTVKEKEKELRDRERRMAEVESKLEKARERESAAERHNQQALVNPIFERHRFAGKLGDSDAEYRLDKMLWTQVVNNLQSLENVNTETIEKEFKQVAEDVRRVVKIQSEKETKKVVRNKKKKAAKDAADRATNKDKIGEKELNKALSARDYTGIIEAIFSGRDSVF